MITAMPAVKPTITGSGMKRMTAPSRASPISTSITPAISVAISSPLTPNCATTPARITMKAPVGPAIWIREPPSSATATPAMIDGVQALLGLDPRCDREGHRQRQRHHADDHAGNDVGAASARA